MTSINAIPSAQPVHDPGVDRQAQSVRELRSLSQSQPDRVRDAFTQFVGETFYAQMLKAMRTSLGKPAYFHGGRAEEVFTSQLDQTLAQELADKSTERFIGPLFEQQFPHLASRQATVESAAGTSGLAALDTLRRR